VLLTSGLFFFLPVRFVFRPFFLSLLVKESRLGSSEAFLGRLLHPGSLPAESDQISLHLDFRVIYILGRHSIKTPSLALSLFESGGPFYLFFSILNLLSNHFLVSLVGAVTGLGPGLLS
jgi:hypothetical protein